jgi:Zn-finger nucleic acid-binding protein
MKCPIDGSDLVMAERQGIEIDYCPKCRGVWLDRGELDKIIERAAAEESPRTAAAPAPAPQPNYAPPPQSAPYPQPSHHYPKQGYYDPRYKKRKSLLGELFDFD